RAALAAPERGRRQPPPSDRPRARHVALAFLDVDDLAAAVRAAVRTGAMALRRLATLRTGDHVGCLERVVRAPLVSLRRRRAALGDGHRVSSSCRRLLGSRMRGGILRADTSARALVQVRAAALAEPPAALPAQGARRQCQDGLLVDERGEVDLLARVGGELELLDGQLSPRDARRDARREHEGEAPIEREGIFLEATRAAPDDLAAHRALEEEIETGAVILHVHRHARCDLEVADAAAEPLVQLLHLLDVREVLRVRLDVPDGDLHGLAAGVTIARGETPTKGGRLGHPGSSEALIPRARSTRRTRRSRPGTRGMLAETRRHSRAST